MNSLTLAASINCVRKGTFSRRKIRKKFKRIQINQQIHLI